jgi:hypothetical protein
MVSFCKRELALISGFRRDVDEICGLMGNYTASCGNYLLTFRDNVSVPSSRVKIPKLLNIIHVMIIPQGVNNNNIDNIKDTTTTKNKNKQKSTNQSSKGSDGFSIISAQATRGESHVVAPITLLYYTEITSLCHR